MSQKRNNKWKIKKLAQWLQRKLFNRQTLQVTGVLEKIKVSSKVWLQRPEVSVRKRNHRIKTF
jgi:hypothetical protein